MAAGLTSASGTLATTNDAVTLTQSGDYPTCLVQIGAANNLVGILAFEGSVDGTNFVGLAPYGAVANSSTGTWALNCAGYISVRVRLSTGTSGSATANLKLSLTPLEAGSVSNSVTHRVSTNDTNSVLVKGAPGVLYGVEVGNNSGSADCYLKLYNKATAPTVGTDTPVRVIYIPKGTSKGFTSRNGIAFTTGLGFGVVTGAANADTTAVAAAAVVISLEYQ